MTQFNNKSFTVGSTSKEAQKKYSDNWDSIFGNKAKNSKDEERTVNDNEGEQAGNRADVIPSTEVEDQGDQGED